MADGVAETPPPVRGWSARTGGLRLLGWLVTAAALIFVARRALEVGGLDRFAEPSTLAAVAASSVAYAALCVLLVVAWRLLLRGCAADLGFGAAYAIFGRSQIAKYLPGNVFHLAGRQVYALRAGVPGVSAAASLTLEHLSLVSAAAALGLGHLLLVGPSHAGLSAASLASIALAAVAAPWLIGRLARGTAAFLERRGRLPRRLAPLVVAGDAAGRFGLRPGAYALHLSFFVGAGALLLLLGSLGRSLAMIDPSMIDPSTIDPSTVDLPTLDATSATALVLAFAPAWLAGLVTPGAAAGIGVREAVLLTAFDGVGVAADEGLFLVVSLRLATTLGDVLTWLTSLVPSLDGAIAMESRR